MIRTLIVDDEELARKRLRRMLAPFGDVDVVGEAENGAEAVTKIESERPDLVFLDVQMPDLDGFGALRMIEIDRMPMVIFVTAFDQFAVNAFEVNAIDYLLKPVHRQRLEQAVAKAREKSSSRDQAGAALTQFLKSFAPPSLVYLRRLPVRSQNRILILNVDQITSLRVDRGLVCAATAEGEFWTKYTALTELENQLDPQVFYRVHRQVIVNLNHVREINAFDNSTARLTLTGGQQVNVSRNHLPGLRQLLQTTWHDHADNAQQPEPRSPEILFLKIRHLRFKSRSAPLAQIVPFARFLHPLRDCQSCEPGACKGPHDVLGCKRRKLDSLRYSCRSAINGSTFVARRAGM